MKRLIRRGFLLACLLAGQGAAFAQTPTVANVRAPSAQENASFAAFHQKTFGSAPAAPLWQITRADARSPWMVVAALESAPARGLRNLCRAERMEFRLTDKRWRAADRARQFAWLQAGACRANPNAAELLQRMPDTEVVKLLGAQAAILPKARLIMAGNSNCAALRSSPFRFAAIDVGRAGSGVEEMAGLVYRGDNAAQVTVWVRANGVALDNWNVSCPPRPVQSGLSSHFISPGALHAEKNHRPQA